MIRSVVAIRLYSYRKYILRTACQPSVSLPHPGGTPRASPDSLLFSSPSPLPLSVSLCLSPVYLLLPYSPPPSAYILIESLIVRILNDSLPTASPQIRRRSLCGEQHPAVTRVAPRPASNRYYCATFASSPFCNPTLPLRCIGP